MTAVRLPTGAALVRTTPTWDGESIPAGLLRAHRIADGTWGRLVVEEGTLEFVFEDDGSSEVVGTGRHLVIPPGRPHHVNLSGPVRFFVEFYASPER